MMPSNKGNGGQGKFPRDGVNIFGFIPENLPRDIFIYSLYKNV